MDAIRYILKNRRRIAYPVFLFAFTLLTLAPGCKPTERNYKSAYDAALAKRQAKVDADLDIPAEGLMVEGQPSRRNVEGVEVLYLAAPLSSIDEGSVAPKDFNLVAGCFKMPVNALDQARTLREEGFEAFAVRGEHDLYYTVVSGFDTLPEAAEFYAFFQARHPDFTYVGLPSLTIIEKR